MLYGALISISLDMSLDSTQQAAAGELYDVNYSLRNNKYIYISRA